MDLFAFSDEVVEEKKLPDMSKYYAPYLPREIFFSNEVILKMDYRKGLCTTYQYYFQYVTQEIVDLVVSRLGKEAIMKSTKHNFADIRQDLWDSLDGPIHLVINKEQIKQAGEDIPYLCFNVCVAIAAATAYKAIND